MELKFSLKSNGSISAAEEYQHILLWNDNNKSNMIYYVSGEISDFEGKIEIVSELHSVEYSYAISLNPTIKPIYSFILDGNNILINNEIDELCTEFNSLCIALMYFLKRKLKYINGDDITVEWNEDVALKLVKFIHNRALFNSCKPSEILRFFKQSLLQTGKKQ
jgi:hypothetical protein